MKTLGGLLRTRREELNLSQKELAERVGVAYTTIRSWEDDSRTPGLDDLLVLSDVLGLSLEKLILALTPSPKDVRERLETLEKERATLLEKLQRNPSNNNLVAKMQLKNREINYVNNLVRHVEKLTRSGAKFSEPVPLVTKPVLGTAGLGYNTPAEEYVTDYVPVPADLGVDYILEVRGDSMKDVDLLHGDRVWVKATSQAKHGELVVALINGGTEGTVKYLVKDGKNAILRAANTAYPEYVMGEGDRIVGKVIRLERLPRPMPDNSFDNNHTSK